MSGRARGWTEEIALNALRVVAGFLFWQHGAQKLFGLFGGWYAGGQEVEFFSIVGLAGLLETAGGAMLIFGLFTRPVAFILSGEMAWAYFSTHAPVGFWPIMTGEAAQAGGNGGELAAVYAFVFLFIAARGGGAFSLDGLLRLKKGKATPPAPEAPKASADPAPKEDFPELTEEDLAEDPEIAELLGDTPGT